MKILKKALLIFYMLLLGANNAYASTNSTYVENESSGFGKFVLLVIAFALVGLVLLLGYKMDKSELAQKRKDKIIKNRNEKINDIYSEIYTSHNKNSEKENKIEKNKETKEVNEEIIKEDPKKENNIEIEEKLEKNIVTIKFENIVENDNIEENKINEKNEIIENKKENNIEGLKTTSDTVIISTPKIENNKVMDSTMLFDSNLVKNNDLIKENPLNNYESVKGYDYEEDDFELLELEKTIKEANIKRYTRKKENKPKGNVKRYTRKKVIIENDTKVKPKRGRPSKKEAEEKAKRGRPPKTTKAKRGRPPKNKTEKSKRGRPPKKINSNKNKYN